MLEGMAKYYSTELSVKVICSHIENVLTRTHIELQKIRYVLNT